jgi:hypothetical protein
MPPAVALRAGSAPPASLALEHALARPGSLEKLRYLARRAFLEPSVMRRRSGLARRGSVGLVIVYVGRLGWLLARVPGAVWAVGRARRVSRQGR